jgi:4-carboxymuconolactone decarboxylase
MPRIPALRREDLAEAETAIYDDIADSRGEVIDLFRLLLHRPEFAKRAAHLGTYVRYEAEMPSRHRHLIGMVVGRRFDCQFEFTAHAVLGRRDGIPADAVVALSRGDEPTGLEEVETALVAFVHRLVATNRVDDTAFTRLRELVGLEALVDIVGATAYFSMIAIPMNAFGVEVKPGQTAELPLG